MGIPGARPKVDTPALPGHHPVRDASEAGGYIEAMEMPAGLSDGAQVVWQMITPELIRGKVLREDDVIPLIEACEAWAQAIWFRKHLQRQQAVYDEMADQTPPVDEDELKLWMARFERTSAEIKRLRSGWNAAYKMALSASGDMGLGPVARVRMGLAKVQGASLLEALTKGVSGQGDT